MKFRLTALLSVCAGLALAAPACKKDAPAEAPKAGQTEEQAEEQATDEADASQAEAAGPAERRRPAPPAVKTVEEHMAEVSQEITAANYKDELAKLEEQINQRFAQTERVEASRAKAAEGQPAEGGDAKVQPE